MTDLRKSTKRPNYQVGNNIQAVRKELLAVTLEVIKLRVELKEANERIIELLKERPEWTMKK